MISRITLSMLFTPLLLLLADRYWIPRLEECMPRARVSEIAGRNRVGAEDVTSSAVDQAEALRGLEGAINGLREVVKSLNDLAHRITNIA